MGRTGDRTWPSHVPPMSERGRFTQATCPGRVMATTARLTLVSRVSVASGPTCGAHTSLQPCATFMHYNCMKGPAVESIWLPRTQPQVQPPAFCLGDTLHA